MLAPARPSRCRECDEGHRGHGPNWGTVPRILLGVSYVSLGQSDGSDASCFTAQLQLPRARN